jgi:hypothetical protein
MSNFESRKLKTKFSGNCATKMWDKLTDKYRKCKSNEQTRGVNLGEDQNREQGSLPDVNS